MTESQAINILPIFLSALVTLFLGLFLFIIKKWISDIGTTLTTITDKIANLDKTLAVQESKIIDGVELRKEFTEGQKQQILLTSRVDASWRKLDELAQKIDRLETKKISNIS